MSASSAATEIMNTPRSDETCTVVRVVRRIAISSFLSCRPVARTLEQLRARIAVHHLRQPVHGVLLLGRQGCRHVDQEAIVDVPATLGAEPRRTLAAQPLHRPVL